jgi:hypothetical protein
MDFSLHLATGNALHFLARQGTKKGQPGYGLPLNLKVWRLFGGEPYASVIVTGTS